MTDSTPEIVVVLEGNPPDISVFVEETPADIQVTVAEVGLVGPPGPVGPQGPAGDGDTDALLNEHVNSSNPHPVYDNMVDLALIVQNGLV